MRYVTFPLAIMRNYMANPSTLYTAVFWCIIQEIEQIYPDINKRDLRELLKTNYSYKCGYGCKPEETEYLIELREEYPTHEKYCLVSISNIMVERYVKDDVSEWERVKFLGYIALKSIDGANKRVAKANNRMMWARMAGYTTWKEFEQSGTINECGLQKYFNEYYSKKMRDAVSSDYKNVKIYAKNVRGFYFTTKPEVPLDEVVEYAIRASPAFKKKKQKQTINAAEQRVRAKLGI